MKPFQLYFHMVLFGFRYFFENENLIVFLNLDLSSPGTESERGEGFKSSKKEMVWHHQTRGGGVLPYKRLMGTCRCMGSHFQDWIDYNGVAFSKELLELGRTFSDVLG